MSYFFRLKFRVSLNSADQPGDRVCLFGFSRGAYIARALAGMTLKVGLLNADSGQDVKAAYKLYADSSRSSWLDSKAFKDTYSSRIKIQFIGVWYDPIHLIRRFPLKGSQGYCQLRWFNSQGSAINGNDK